MLFYETLPGYARAERLARRIAARARAAKPPAACVTPRGHLSGLAVQEDALALAASDGLHNPEGWPTCPIGGLRRRRPRPQAEIVRKVVSQCEQVVTCSLLTALLTFQLLLELFKALRVRVQGMQE